MRVHPPHSGLRSIAQFLLASVALCACLGLHPNERDSGVADADAGWVDAGQVDGGTADSGVQTDLARAVLLTTSGPVQGARGAGDSVALFKGIPFAAPPITSNRWRAPQPAAPWAHVRDATQYGFACLQVSTPFIPNSLLPTEAQQSEDCLTLNAWTPAATPDAGLPVMLWFHGGGWNVGASWLPEYEGTTLARDGRVVVITANYRMGQMGYASHPALSAESGVGASGNYGLLDQLAALRWARDNARALGGDPNNITLFGESAGGGSVCHLLVSPLARGLFHRAIVQSASCIGSLRSLRQSSPKWPSSGEALGQLLEQRLGCTRSSPSETLACMRAATFTQLKAAVPPSSGTFDPQGEKFWPQVDGYSLTEQPAATFNRGGAAPVPLLIGSLENEMGLFFASSPELQGVDTRAKYLAEVQQTFGAYTPTVFAQYDVPVGRDELANSTYKRLLRDVTFACPSRYTLSKMAPAVPSGVFRYVITHVHPSGKVALASGPMGAYHGADLFYMFGNLDPYQKYAQPSAANQGHVISAGDTSLSAIMVSQWARFAATGNPNGPGLPTWPTWQAGTDSYLELAAPPVAGAGYQKSGCDVFDPLFAATR